MTLGINTNLAALDTQRQQARSQSDLGTAIARLSSGLRINSAKDDAAGLAIADRFTAQIRGTTQAGRNANDGISLAQTADGALASIGANLQRIRELSVQAANATNSASDRASLQLEVTQLQSEIDRVATQTQFNGINLLDGSFTSKQFQVGANVGQTVSVAGVASARSAALGTYNGFSLVNQDFGSAHGSVQPLTVTIGSGAPIDLGTTDINHAASVVIAINAAHIQGLSATPNPLYVAGPAATTTLATSSGTASIDIDGIAIALHGIAGPGNEAANRASAVAAINGAQGAITAVDNGHSIDFTSPAGWTLNLSMYAAGSFVNSQPSDFGLWASMYQATTFNVDYVAPAGTTGNVVFAQTGGYNSTTPIGVLGTSMAAIDVSTSHGATAALSVIDNALASVDATRAMLGATQNRFASTTLNLQSAGDNQSASRSRIEDADFALETANLSRAQVLQQAGTAMLAQANQGTGQVLALLRSG